LANKPDKTETWKKTELFYKITKKAKLALGFSDINRYLSFIDNGFNNGILELNITCSKPNSKLKKKHAPNEFKLIMFSAEEATQVLTA
jgi:hypothetical protein